MGPIVHGDRFALIKVKEEPMATTVPQPLRWVILILIALVMLPIVAMTLAVTAIAWMPLTAALGAFAIWLLMRWHHQTADPRQ
jgi:hypothetical protein